MDGRLDMVRIINLKTGKERTKEPPPLPKCEVCGVEVEEKLGGVCGDIGRLPVAFCGICISGIISIVVENNGKEK
jgi:hypothetical protein